MIIRVQGERRVFEIVICWLIEKLGMGKQKWESTLDPLWCGLGMPIEDKFRVKEEQ